MIATDLRQLLLDTMVRLVGPLLLSRGHQLPRHRVVSGLLLVLILLLLGYYLALVAQRQSALPSPDPVRDVVGPGDGEHL